MIITPHMGVVMYCIDLYVHSGVAPQGDALQCHVLAQVPADTWYWRVKSHTFLDTLRQKRQFTQVLPVKKLIYLAMSSCKGNTHTLGVSLHPSEPYWGCSVRSSYTAVFNPNHIIGSQSSDFHHSFCYYSTGSPKPQNKDVKHTSILQHCLFFTVLGSLLHLKPILTHQGKLS